MLVNASERHAAESKRIRKSGIILDRAKWPGAIGVLGASLFGSVARGDAGPDSDIDVVVRLAGNFSKGGFDYFGRLEDLKRRLSAILGCKVDVIEEPVRKGRLQAEIDKDRALAF